MRVGRGILKAGVGGMAVAAGAASVAFGCAAVTSPYLNALEPNRGAVPASVVVSGGNWAANQDVNLVWVPTGESIGSAQTSGNGSFSTRVTIPASAETGRDYVHYVRATQGTTTGNTPFGVDSPAEDREFAVPPPAPVTYASTSGGDPNNKTANQPPAEETRTAPAPSGGSGGIPSRPAETDSNSATQPGAAPVTASNANGSTSAAPARTPAPSRQQGADPATDRAAAPSSPLAPSAPSGAAVPVTEQEATAAARSASGDLWSGFAQGPATVGAPSLTALPTTTSGTSPLAIAMGVLSGGLVALFAGFGVADLRRRREMATKR